MKVFMLISAVLIVLVEEAMSNNKIWFIWDALKTHGLKVWNLGLQFEVGKIQCVAQECECAFIILG
jgi:hypothetical protein